MSTIGDLCVTSSVSSDDKLPIWKNCDGVTRALPISVLDGRYLTKDDVAALAASPTTETFVSVTDFTPGVSLSLTLANQYYSAQNIEVFFDAAYQGPDQYSLVGLGLIFTSPIPVGVQKVYVRGGAVRVEGVPSDGSVTAPSLGAGAVGTPALADGSVTPPKLNLVVASGTATDVQNVQMVRVANYSGGTFGFVNSTLRVRNDVGMNAGTFESAASFILNNSSTANNAENFALLGQGNKTASNVVGTWASVFEAHETVPINNPTTPTIGTEIDIYANGTDSLLQRIGLGIFTKGQDATGAACQTGYGISLASSSGDTHPGNFAVGVGFGRFASITQFNYGLDFTYASFAFGGAAINMIANQVIAFAPSRNLTYNGAALSYQTPSNPGGVMQVLDNGNVQNVNNSYGAISDRRLKDNIEDIGDALSSLRKVRIRQYDMDGVHHFGVVAQELRRVFPHLIEHLKRGKKKFFGVNYMGLLPWTVRAVQQVDEQNKALEKRVEALEMKIARLEKLK